MSVLSVQPLSQINQQFWNTTVHTEVHVPCGRMPSDKPGAPGPVRDNPSHRIGHLTWLYDFITCQSKGEQSNGCLGSDKFRMLGPIGTH